ncbi:CPCC family cysteine-rich protein [Sphaerisporangium sp. NBC_01403]|uniref:CPCC family cysteine-rich protein n=1 Tax=Sphaerisporangium sp. NBC_01403 TaxID=2903599 RepID=UPI00386FF450
MADQQSTDISHPCPCCGYLTLDEPGNYEICHLCFWEDDGDDGRGPNRTYMAEARANFLRWGAMDQRFIYSVRPPEPQEIPPDGSALPLPPMATVKRRRRLP